MKKNDYLILSLIIGALSLVSGLYNEIGLQVLFVILQGILLYKGVRQ